MECVYYIVQRDNVFYHAQQPMPIAIQTLDLENELLIETARVRAGM